MKPTTVFLAIVGLLAVAAGLSVAYVRVVNDRGHEGMYVTKAPPGI